ncbi:2,3-butanediol dehydrogenase [Kocuria coralli]|uniref:2,3-butanediol dehydrogenase n=1 Tax=Kocuria coralli TaxID=1461025 RepID=A0A5J5KYE5_9MICC|nr:2,3-butanediol dehydrogenase [Kocuria coralli]KAA9394542.1 2,3-butanediol dehydrogenase [Kocuria coralli]
MKAARFHAQEDLRIEDIEEPVPGPGEVKIRNAYSGICGSDLHFYYAPEASGVNINEPHPITGAKPPQVLGHEFSGTVVELGDGVDGVEVGDRVVVWPIYYCGSCAACGKGMYNICRTIAFHGLSSNGGGMAEFTTIPASKVHVLPEGVDLRMGALVEPMAVAWHAVEASGIQAGQTAMIIGAGPIGIGVWFALRAHGVETVIVSEPSDERRAAIEGVGADLVVNPMAQDLAARVQEETGGRGVDVAFDAAGIGPALSGALTQLAPGGRAIVVAIHERPTEIQPTQFVMGETGISGTLAYLPEDFDAVIQAMADGKYTSEGWVSEVSLDGVVDAFHALRSGRRMKVLVRAD